MSTVSSWKRVILFAAWSDFSSGSSVNLFNTSLSSPAGRSCSHWQPRAGGGEGKELGEERVPTSHPLTVSKEMAPRVIQELQHFTVITFSWSCTVASTEARKWVMWGKGAASISFICCLLSTSSSAAAAPPARGWCGSEVLQIYRFTVHSSFSIFLFLLM